MMTSFKVVSLRTSEADIRIDRRTPYGNPFKMDTESQRNEVVDRFAVWWLAPAQDGLREALLTDIRELQHQRLMAGEMVSAPIRLGCWCAPQRCHGDVIKRWLERTERE